jgi:peroxiredoxin
MDRLAGTPPRAYRLLQSKEHMKILHHLCTLATLLAVTLRGQPAPAKSAEAPPVLKIGAQAPDFSLPGTDGAVHSLTEYGSSKVLVLVFTCNHCPVAEMYERRIKTLAADYKDRGATIVAINPNDPKALKLSELRYSDVGDSLPEMKIRAEYRQFNFPYLSDSETQAASKKYGPVSTPHVFVLDRERKLRYQGRIDNYQNEELATKHEARDAVEALLAGRPVPVETTPAVGCSIKWANKEAGAAEETDKADREPVRVEMAGVDQMKELRKNAAKTFVLVNFWATWCEPCEDELPDLQAIYRSYRQRLFDMVLVSTNDPEDKEGVLKVLNEQHAISRNYLFNVADPIDIIAAFGADFDGGVPFTVLLNPEGKILYTKQGGINPLEVRRVILKNLPDDAGRSGIHAYWNSSF